MDQYSKQLYDLQEKINHKAELKNILKTLKNKKLSLEQEEKILAEIRIKEQGDVEKLEGVSLSSLFYSITGQKEDHIEKERHEASIAAAKHDNVCVQLKSINKEIEEYNYQLMELSSCEKEYERLLNEKAEFIKKTDLVNGPKILKFEEQLQILINQCKEIDEAYSIGKNILNKIQEIKVALDKAGDWGTYDLFGGGLICDMIKYSHLDNAQLEIKDLQQLLGSYKTELTDVQIQLETQVNIEGVLYFADFIFDGLFVDWAVLESIQDSEKQIENTNKQVQQVQRQLNTMSNDIQAKIQEIQAERNQKVLRI